MGKAEQRQTRRLGSGQASVEGAFLIPVILVLLMLLIQPGILLYNRMVMMSAAAEGCRVLATQGSSQNQAACEEFVRRRLGAVPEQDNFHVHSGGCTWEIVFQGGDSSSTVSVEIRNQVDLLPLFDLGAGLMGALNGSGHYQQKVVVERNTYASWVSSNELGLDPGAWVTERGDAS